MVKADCSLPRAAYTGWMKANYYIKEKLKVKVAKWGTPKKPKTFPYLKLLLIIKTVQKTRLFCKNETVIDQKGNLTEVLKILLETKYVFCRQTSTKRNGIQSKKLYRKSYFLEMKETFQSKIN